MLRRYSKKILNDKWYADRNMDSAKESDRIITTAAKLIRASIRETVFCTEYYPSNEVIGNLSKVKEWMPHSVQILMQNLFNNELKQIAIGHSIVQACKTRSVISPLLYALGVSMDHVFGSEWLVRTLAQLGFSSSYDEVMRFKQSVVMSKDEEIPL